jgi:hypothetical protein
MKPSCVVPNIDFSLGGTSGLDVTLAEAHGTDGVELASPMAKKLASLSAYNWDILSSASPCGSNCSYELQFNWPTWKCTPSSVDNSSAVGAFQAPTPSVFGSNTGNMWLHSPSYLADLSNETGLFWVGSSIHVDYDNNIPNGGLNIAIFSCENWNATYDLRINYTSSVQSIELQNLTYLNNFSIPYILETATSNGINIIQVPPQFQSSLHYTHAALFRSLGELVQGDIVREPHGPPILRTDLASIPGLISFSESAGYLDGHYQPVSNMRSAVE